MEDFPYNVKEEIKSFHDNGKKREVQFLFNNYIVGIREFDECGILLYECGMKENKKHGYERRWFRSGELEFQTNYVDGLEHGTAIQYGFEGNILGKYEMIMGTGIDKWWGENGRLLEEAESKKGKLNGFKRTWDEHGILISEIQFKDNLQHGICKEWDSDGALLPGYPVYYQNGLQVTKDEYE